MRLLEHQAGILDILLSFRQSSLWAVVMGECMWYTLETPHDNMIPRLFKQATIVFSLVSLYVEFRRDNQGWGQIRKIRSQHWSHPPVIETFCPHD